MRLKSVFISQYKNLHNFELTFDGTSFIDVFVGKNGSGKSNLFEALIEIFRHLVEFGGPENTIGFDYQLTYEIEGREVHLDWRSGRLYIDGDLSKKMGSTPLPDNLLIYYSGHNSTVGDLIAHYEDEFRERIKRAGAGESRWFLGIGPEYKSLLLTMLLIQPEDNPARKYVFEKLGIERLGLSPASGRELTEPVIRLVLERPEYAEGNKRFDIELNDESDRYWKAEGIVKQFLEGLTRCEVRLSERFTIREGYIASDDRYVLHVSLAKLQAEFAERGALWLFRQFDNLKTLGMLAEIAVPLKLKGGAEGNVQFFSDGQFQTVYIYAIVELFKDSNCLMLLDEPDAFLHPEWQFEFLKQVFEISEAATAKNHVLMSSHSAATLCCLEERQIRLFKVDGPRIDCCKRSKKDVIRELSDSFIQYSEDESRLLIDNVIRTSSRPILFVEGPSDVSILNTAYQKLYPNEDMPVLVQDAFDRGFIKILLARGDVFRIHPQKCFFALFDFDDAYDDWRELGGVHTVIDIGVGLCRKLEDKNAYTFMLPIPDNELREQVWDEQNPIEKIKPNPHFCIEHVFWGAGGLEGWFRNKNGLIEFKGDKYKVRFANEVIPGLDAEKFTAFRPMFDFIKAHCAVTEAVTTPQR
jgi:predicted ATPase